MPKLDFVFGDIVIIDDCSYGVVVEMIQKGVRFIYGVYNRSLGFIEYYEAERLNRNQVGKCR